MLIALLNEAHPVPPTTISECYRNRSDSMTNKMRTTALFIAFSALSAWSQPRLDDILMAWGLNASFVAPENLGPTLGGAVRFDVSFKFDRIGTFSYFPSIDLWTRGKDRGTRPYDNDYRITQRNRYTQLALNIGDGRYIPPVRDDFPLKPYAGFGPGMVVRWDRWIEEFEPRDPGPAPFDRSDIDSDIGSLMNLFTGMELRVTSRAYFFFELRGKFRNRDVFKMSAGAFFPFGN